MSDEPVVRAATKADLPRLLDLYDELAEDREPSRPARGELARTQLAAIAAQPGRVLLVAELAGSVVATADLLVVTNLTHGGQPWAVVENVVVAADLRRRGVGRLLMADVVRRCRQQGCYKVQLLSRRHRHVAHAFYRSLGFSTSAEGFRLYLDDDDP